MTKFAEEKIDQSVLSEIEAIEGILNSVYNDSVQLEKRLNFSLNIHDSVTSKIDNAKYEITLARRKIDNFYDANNKVKLLWDDNNTSQTKNVKASKNINNKEDSGVAFGKKVSEFFKYIVMPSLFPATTIVTSCYSLFNKSKDINISPINISPNYAHEQLEKIRRKAEEDTQVNTSGKFSELTDFQNMMFGDFVMLEVAFTFSGKNEDLKGKTINELYEEYFYDTTGEEVDYEKILLDIDYMSKMGKDDDLDEAVRVFKSQLLGKLVRYGMGDFKIVDKVTGENGFDAFVLEDVDGNIMIHYDGTFDPLDVAYDVYPIMASLSKGAKRAGDNLKLKDEYRSQQAQASSLLSKYLNDPNVKGKVMVSGFSLGGSLAERAYLNNFGSKKLSDIIVVNSYHDRLSENEARILKSSGHLKIYANEGDMVSTIFNYDDFKDVTKPVYIDYKVAMEESKAAVDNGGNSLPNLVANLPVRFVCDKAIDLCDTLLEIPKFDGTSNAFLLSAKSILGLVKSSDIVDAAAVMNKIEPVIKELSVCGKRLLGKDANNGDLEFIDNLEYLGDIFTTFHMTYSFDKKKHISFDENGNVKSEVDLETGKYEVTYPPFDEVSTELFGSDIYDDVYGILN